MGGTQKGGIGSAPDFSLFCKKRRFFAKLGGRRGEAQNQIFGENLGQVQGVSACWG